MSELFFIVILCVGAYFAWKNWDAVKGFFKTEEPPPPPPAA